METKAERTQAMEGSGESAVGPRHGRCRALGQRQLGVLGGGRR